MKSLSARLSNMLVAIILGSVLLTGCVSADKLFASPTMKARGPAPAAPESPLKNELRAPQGPERRDFDQSATVVSLTFDDGNASQYAAVEAMDRLGLLGTFYVNSSVLGTPDYLSLAQLDQMTERGHEIGGHGVQHRNLTLLEPGEVQRQICLDRKNLIQWGYKGTSFAYPEAGSDEVSRVAAEHCGYNSARGLGALASVTGCEDCPVAESFTPAEPMLTKAPAMVHAGWTVADMQGLVLKAEENGGGWVQLTYHHICPTACNSLSADIADFEEFIAWLAAREATTGTVVRTVDEVIGGATEPVVDALPRPADAEENLVINSGFEVDPRANDLSRCWQTSGFGNNNGSGEIVSHGIDDSNAIRLRISEIVDGDYKFLQRLDMGECASGVVPGARYKMSAQYEATTDSQFVIYLRDDQGSWLYWTASEWIAPSTGLKEIAWVAPPIPEGFTGLAMGMSVFSEGTLTVDDVKLSVHTGHTGYSS